MPPPSHVVGIDASLTNTALVAIDLAGLRRKPLTACVTTRLIETDPSDQFADRLITIYRAADGFFSQLRARTDYAGAAVAVEGFSFGDRFRQYDLGAVQGILRVTCRAATGLLIASVTPQTAKRFICPEWPGWSLQHWIANGYRGKFKRSMPGKADVAAALFARYKFDPGNEHVVDATLVALAHAHAIGVIDAPPYPPVQPEFTPPPRRSGRPGRSGPARSTAPPKAAQARRPSPRRQA